MVSSGLIGAPLAIPIAAAVRTATVKLIKLRRLLLPLSIPLILFVATGCSPGRHINCAVGSG